MALHSHRDSITAKIRRLTAAYFHPDRWSLDLCTMRLFKSKKSDKSNASRPDTPSGNAEESVPRRHDGDVEGGDASIAQQQQQQESQERPPKAGRGMQAMMNRQPRQLTDQDIVQESIGLSQRTRHTKAVISI